MSAARRLGAVQRALRPSPAAVADLDVNDPAQLLGLMPGWTELTDEQRESFDEDGVREPTMPTLPPPCPSHPPLRTVSGGAQRPEPGRGGEAGGGG